MKYRFNQENKRYVKTALVLSGGGAKGAYQVGVIKELLRRGIKLDLVIGSSIGAFNGALLAEYINLNLPATEIYRKLTALWIDLHGFVTFNWWGFLKNIFWPLKIPPIFTNKAMKRIITREIPSTRKFYDYTRCQLSVTGTNLNKKELRVFDYNSTTPVPQAVLASMAYPVALPSIRIDGDYYIDGGVLNNTPLKEAILWGASTIYVVFLKPLEQIEGEEEFREEGSFPAYRVVEEFVDLASNQLMYGDLKRAEEINEILNIISRYGSSLPRDFEYKLRKMFKLEKGDGKRLIRIIKIAPEEVLDPPGTAGFRNKKAIEEIIKRGQEDTRKELS